MPIAGALCADPPTLGLAAALMFRSLLHAAGNNAYLLLTLAAASWAGNHALGRAIAGHVPPASLSVLRWVGALAILLPLAWPYLRADWRRILDSWRIMLFLGIVGGAIFSTLQYVGLKYTTALNMAVLNSLPPAVIAAIGCLIFGDRIRASQVVGLAVSLIGVLVIVSAGSLARLASLTLNTGDLVIILNMTLWAIYSACLRLRPAVHGLSFVTVMAFIAAAGNLPLLAFEHVSGDRLQATWATALTVAYTAIFPSVLAYVCWSRGIEMIGATRGGVFLHLVPPFGAVLATLFLGETLGMHHLAGFVLILAGVKLATAAPARPAGAPKE